MRITLEDGNSCTGTQSRITFVAKRMFAMAVALDPLYARAYAGIADCDSFLFFTTTLTCRSTEFLATSAKAWILRAVSQKRTFHLASPLSLRGEIRKRWRSSIRPSPSIPDLFEAHYFYARACFTPG